MTIFTNRELERVASLRMNWRKEFLLEVVRLWQEPDIARPRDRLPSAKAANIRSSADNRSTTSCPRPYDRHPTYLVID
jgi:hypothetical protein